MPLIGPFTTKEAALAACGSSSSSSSSSKSSSRSASASTGGGTEPNPTCDDKLANLPGLYLVQVTSTGTCGCYNGTTTSFFYDDDDEMWIGGVSGGCGANYALYVYCHNNDWLIDMTSAAMQNCINDSYLVDEHVTVTDLGGGNYQLVGTFALTTGCNCEGTITVTLRTTNSMGMAAEALDTPAETPAPEKKPCNCGQKRPLEAKKRPTR